MYIKQIANVNCIVAAIGNAGLFFYLFSVKILDMMSTPSLTIRSDEKVFDRKCLKFSQNLINDDDDDE